MWNVDVTLRMKWRVEQAQLVSQIILFKDRVRVYFNPYVMLECSTSDGLIDRVCCTVTSVVH